MSSAIANAQRHQAAIRAAENHLQAAIEKLHSIKRDAAENDAKLARYEETDANAAARRIVDGPEAAPEAPKRVTAIRNMRERRPHLAAAITLQERRIEEARAAIPPLLAPLAEASLYIVAEVQANALAEIRAALAALTQPAARLIAGDQILAAMLGTKGFPVPAGAPIPVSGSRLLSPLFESIPANIRPDGFDVPTVSAGAREISQPILASITKG